MQNTATVKEEISINQATGEETTVKRPTIWKAGLFGGIYANSQGSVYNMFLACGVQRPLAHKFAMDWASEYGNAQQENQDKGEVVTKRAKGKENEGAFTSKVSSEFKSKGSVFCMHTICCQFDDMKTKKLVIRRPRLNKEDFNELVQSYWEKCEAWVAAQQWDEKTLLQ